MDKWYKLNGKEVMTIFINLNPTQRNVVHFLLTNPGDCFEEGAIWIDEFLKEWDEKQPDKYEREM